MLRHLSALEYLDLLRSPLQLEECSPLAACTAIVVNGPVPSTEPLALPPCPVINIEGDGFHELVDIATDQESLDALAAAIAAQPLAAATLVQVLRHNAGSSIFDGLLAESLAYSTLQHSAGFLNWLENTQRPAAYADQHEVLTLNRTDRRLELTLNRPAVHNAYNAALKDALCAALQLACMDPQVEQLALRGNGPSFCAGGDLSEFGSAQQDAGLAHLSRTTRSGAALLARYPGNSTAHLHGACIGAGIELPAFCDRVIADADSFFQLPEVAMGLIPGAGGTVSITRRIGRHRTAWMALTNQRVAASTALKWGLIDQLT